MHIQTPAGSLNFTDSELVIRDSYGGEVFKIDADNASVHVKEGVGTVLLSVKGFVVNLFKRLGGTS